MPLWLGVKDELALLNLSTSLPYANEGLCAIEAQSYGQTRVIKLCTSLPYANEGLYAVEARSYG